jgi:hypothetical protein
MLKVISIALIVAGIGLAFWGYQLSDSVGSAINQTLTGAYTDKVMALYIAGAVCFVTGVVLSSKK